MIFWAPRYYFPFSEVTFSVLSEFTAGSVTPPLLSQPLVLRLTHILASLVFPLPVDQ
jgi:hypothetical protein